MLILLIFLCFSFLVSGIERGVLGLFTREEDSGDERKLKWMTMDLAEGDFALHVSLTRANRQQQV